MTERSSYSHAPNNPTPPNGFSGPTNDESRIVMQTQRNTYCEPVEVDDDDEDM